MTNKVSLYIPCYNVEQYIGPVIEGVLRQTCVPDEILIIDDGCKDRTVEIAARYPVLIVKHEGNRGLAAARNTGIRNARNEAISSLDSDCVPEPDWLEKLMAAFDDPRVALAGGQLREGILDSTADRWRQAHMSQDWGTERLIDPAYIFGNNQIVRRKVIEEVGWYTENLRTNGEDVDISKRVLAAGYRVVYEPMARVTHVRRDNIRSVMNTYWRWYNAETHRMKVRSILGRALKLHPNNSFALICEDLQNGNYELLGIDLLTLIYMPYFDVSVFFTGGSPAYLNFSN